ncbi:MAG: type II toxin-antitoxin system RelE/ParE family toxin [Mycobacteriales bacterium]
MWSVDIELIAKWLASLDDDSQAQVVAAIELLQEHGPRLGRPLVDTVTASRHKNMKELRPGSSGRSELRVLFAFDPKRQGILLVAGDKARELEELVQEEHPGGRRPVRRPPGHVERRVIEMAMSLKDFLAEHPVDRERVEANKERMLSEVRAYRLRELRESAGLTQEQLAQRIGVGQRQVSKIEHGDLDNAKIGTIRSYLEAVGGDLAIEYVTGDARIQVA